MNETPLAGNAPTFQETSRPEPRLVPLAFLLAPILAVAGGLVTGQLIVKFGMVGGIALWGAGAAAGFLARRIMRAPCVPVAWALVVACFLAYGMAEISWYRWSVSLPDEQGGRRDPTWSEAVMRAPTYLTENAPIGLFVGALFALFGAQSAYWQAGKRYRLVAVADDH